MEFSRQEYWSGLSLLQGIFPTQESNRGLLHCRQILYQLSYQESQINVSDYRPMICLKGFLGGSDLPPMQETQVWSLSWEDPLEKGMGTHSNILAWRIPWTEEPDGLQFLGSQRLRQDWACFVQFFLTSGENHEVTLLRCHLLLLQANLLLLFNQEAATWNSHLWASYRFWLKEGWAVAAWTSFCLPKGLSWFISIPAGWGVLRLPSSL